MLCKYDILTYNDGKYADSPLYFLRMLNERCGLRAYDAAVVRLLHQLDEWYGNTEQEAEDWALEYQLWARMLLSDAPCLMLNPRFLDMSDVLSEWVSILVSVGFDKYKCATYEDMVRNVGKLSTLKPSEDGSFTAVYWPTTPDAVLVQVSAENAPTAKDYVGLINAFDVEPDEQLMPLYIEGESCCAYGFMRDDVADRLYNYNVTTRNAPFCASVRQVLNDTTLENSNHEYTFAGTRTMLWRDVPNKED